MPNDYVAPYTLTPRTDPVPSGQFTVPVCTTPERFDKIMNALFYYGQSQTEFDFDHLIDWLAGVNNIVEGCATFENQCRTIALNSPQVEWFPESPYAPNAEIPAGYEHHPWTIANNDTLTGIIVAWGLGYQSGDVFTDLSKFPDITDPENFLDEYQNLPRFRVTGLVGAGEIEVEILSIPFGGRVVVLVDEFVDLLNLQAADTDADASFPPETIISTTIKTKVTGDGAHTIDYVFYPTFEFELPFIGGGGGVRSIEICGFGVTPMAGEGCCDETNVLLAKILSVQTDLYKLVKGGFELRPLNANASSNLILIGDCFPDHYDNDSDDTGDEITKRSLALCYVTVMYVKALLMQSLADVGVPMQVYGVFVPIAELPPSFSIGRLTVVSPPSAFDVVELVTLFAGTSDLLACQMQAGLIGKSNTFANFKTSFQQTALEAMTVWLSIVLVEANQVEANWRAFNDALTFAMDFDLQNFTCPCVATDCVEPLQLYFKDGRGVSIDLVGENLYHITGTAGYQNPNGSYGGGVYIKDALGRNLTIYHPTTDEDGLPVGWSGQAILYHYVIGACGTPNSEGLTGGFMGSVAGEVVYSEFYWDNQQSPVDTYYKIECWECP